MFEAGTHIQTPRKIQGFEAYTHHGIYIGCGMVIHYSGFHQAGKAGKVEYIEYDEFCADNQAEVYKHTYSLKGNSFPKAEVIQRARSRLGEDEYDLLLNNCEHFCNWCTHGDHHSSQTTSPSINVTRKNGSDFLIGQPSPREVITSSYKIVNTVSKDINKPYKESITKQILAEPPTLFLAKKIISFFKN